MNATTATDTDRQVEDCRIYGHEWEDARCLHCGAKDNAAELAEMLAEYGATMQRMLDAGAAMQRAEREMRQEQQTAMEQGDALLRAGVTLEQMREVW